MEILIYATADVLNTVISFAILAIFARSILSWINPDPKHRLVVGLNQITEPILKPIRNQMPSTYKVDFSPLIALLFLWVFKRFVIGLILSQMA